VRNFLINWETISFSSWILLRGIIYVVKFRRKSKTIFNST